MGGHISHFFEGKCPPSRQINTNNGPIIGRRLVHEGEKLVDAFQGIPFAKPPVGQLRFAKPQPPEPWTETLHCTQFGHRGIQNDMLFTVKWKYGTVSEDNLVLNVFTPVWDAPEGGFPTMVFVHGGGFVSDSSVKYGDIGVCKHLCTKGVVVVTIQYRLGYLGFWSTGDEACPDNLALWDMTLALEWVRDNIRHFNGDPDNVTLFGQSAGGASVDFLSLSPYSRGLFHKVIPMAGNASCEWAVCQEAVEACREVAFKNKVQNDVHSKEYIEELRKLDAMKFATSLKIDPNQKKVSTAIGPRIDGVFLPKSVDELRKEAPSKPRMVGCCRYEGIILMLTNSDASQDRLEEKIAERVPEEDNPEFKRLRAEILEKLIDVDQTHTEDEWRRAMAELYGDIFLNIGCQKNVIDCLENGHAPVYLYSFDYFNPKMWGLLRFKLPFRAATHCTELSYLFAVGIIADFTFNEADMKMLDITSTLWTNFAKYGNPNGDPSQIGSQFPFQWQPATLENPQRHLVIGDEIEMEEVYHNGRPKWWLDNVRNTSVEFTTTQKSHASPQ